MLNTWPALSFTDGLPAMIGATSSMYEKARVWRPSPNTVIGSPFMSWFMKMPTTLRYLSPTFWPSP